MGEVRAAPSDESALESATKEILYGTDAQSLKLLGSIVINFVFSNPLAANPSQLTATISHGLGYEPLFRTFFRPRPDLNHWFSDAHQQNNLDISIDTETASRCLAQADDQVVRVALTGYFGNTYQAKLFVFMDDAQ